MRVARYNLMWFALLLVLGTPALAAEFDLQVHYDKIEQHVAMRDGVKLYTAIYSPKDHSRQYPILLQRTPYSAGPYGANNYRAVADMAPSPAFLQAGYIFVFQDVRGTYQSEGEWENLRPPRTDRHATDESTDTWDTIEWLVKHVPNHNGRVGQWGISHPGWYTVMGMVDSHPALKAVSPQGTTFDAFVGDDDHHNGAFVLSGVEWWRRIGIRTGHRRAGIGNAQPPNIDFGQPWDYDFFLNAGPTDELNDRYFGGDMAPGWKNILEHPDYDAYWERLSVRRSLKHIKVAVLNVMGWFDSTDPYGTLATYQAIEEENPRNRSTLVVGPWAHSGWQETDGSRVGDILFGSKTAEHFQEAVQLPFFEYYLKGNGSPPRAEAIVFETGTNRWHELDEWPPAGKVVKPLYFRADGRLEFNAPTDEGADAHDSYVSDPARPVPYTSKILRESDDVFLLGDQRFAYTRPDVLTYQTAPLSEDLTLAGPIGIDLFVSSTGTDADWVVKLVDVYPGDTPDNEPNPQGTRMGGYQALIGMEVMRAKYRESFAKPVLLVPGQITRIRFEIRDKFHTFRRGHRLMVQVQSSFFPVFDRNPQTFTNIYRAKPAEFQKAMQSVYRSASSPSRLILPVLPQASR
ncbi:MAG: CocE/NonD family hydrolase [Proteobacteria bacterium]|nr:CocE/NonD family hydrolase [Pseudomonadota bacterium]